MKHGGALVMVVLDTPGQIGAPVIQPGAHLLDKLRLNVLITVQTVDVHEELRFAEDVAVNCLRDCVIQDIGGALQTISP